MEQSGINRMKSRKPLFLLFFIAGLFAISAVVMALWNAILPSLAGFSVITYWQAMGLFALSRILFGSFRFGTSHSHPSPFNPGNLRDKLMNMDPQERKNFREEWKSRCDRKD